jgi:D-3-phosphoglycerate dehydrogenase / 2-oxoglutarate reductase
MHPYMVLAEKMGILQNALAPAPIIQRLEIEVRGETVDELVRPVAAALLKGLLERALPDPVNYINAPLLAEEKGITISQTSGVASADYPNLISCRVYWDGGQRTLSGVLFGGTEPRIVQVDNFQLDANPTGLVLILQNHDVPGVIGQVGHHPGRLRGKYR